MQAVFELDIRNITGSRKDADGFLEYVVDCEGEQGSAPFEAIHPFGLWSCPLDPVVDPGSGEPVPSKCCSVLTLTAGNEGFGFALTDPRVIGNLPLGVPGETIVYSAFGSFQRHKADGTVSDSTTTTGGGSDGISVFSETSPTGHRRVGPWGRETFTLTSYRLAHVGGGIFKLGYAGGLMPGGIDPSYASLSAGSVRISGSVVGIGPSTAPQMPVAKVVPLVAILQNIMLAIEALAAGVGSIVATAGPGPVGAPAAAAAAAPIATAQAGLASALETLGTITAIG